MNNAKNSSDLLGRSIPAYDAHVVTRILRAVTVVFWPENNAPSDWSYLQPEESDDAMATAAAKGRTGTAYIYRGVPHSVNTCRDTASAVIYRIAAA